MSRKGPNKTKAWRRETETHMYPQEVSTVNEDGETVKSFVQVPFVLKGRMLRNYRMQFSKAKPAFSGLLGNLMFNAGLVIMNNGEDNSTDLNIPLDSINESMESV